MSTLTASEVTLHTLADWLALELSVDRFQDYAPNGIQVEQTQQVRKIVTGVTASLELLETAASIQADTIIVHHGWFWKNEDPRIIGIKRRRLEILLDAKINLLAYHLPLDAHPQWGNNAQLAKILDIEPCTVQGIPQTLPLAPLVWQGKLVQPITQEAFVQRVEQRLQRKALYVGEAHRLIHSIAWCTGGAQNYMQHAIDAQVDVYLTGEASEQNCHMARETGTAFIAAGHHATERYGIQALGEEIAKKFNVTVEFIEVDNPI